MGIRRRERGGSGGAGRGSTGRSVAHEQKRLLVLGRRWRRGGGPPLQYRIQYDCRAAADARPAAVLLSQRGEGSNGSG